MVTEAQKAAKRRYDKKTKEFVLRFRKDADADIIEKMDAVLVKTEYIRNLIRRDIEQNGI